MLRGHCSFWRRLDRHRTKLGDLAWTTEPLLLLLVLDQFSFRSGHFVPAVKSLYGRMSLESRMREEEESMRRGEFDAIVSESTWVNELVVRTRID